MSDQPPVRWELPWPDQDAPGLGYPPLEGVEHTEIYRATPETGLFSHHSQLTHHGGAFFAAWSNHPDGEDGPGQRVLWAISPDGEEWSQPPELFPPFSVPREADAWGMVLTANGWAPLDGTLYAVAEVHDNPGWQDDSGMYTSRVRTDRCYRRIRIGHGRVARPVSPDGTLGPILRLVEEPPDPSATFPRYADATDACFAEAARRINDWLAHPLNRPAWEFLHWTTRLQAADGELLCEPTAYRRPDGALVRLARHLGRSRRLYAAVSEDDGATWSPLVRTNIPDSPSKSVAGTLPDGRIYLVGNQVERRERDPLVIGLSSDGVVFDRAAAIRSSAPEIRFPGLYKSPGFQYPSVAVADGALWALYSIGKEDVAISRVPLEALPS